MGPGEGSAAGGGGERRGGGSRGAAGGVPGPRGPEGRRRYGEGGGKSAFKRKPFVPVVSRGGVG